MKVIEEVWWKKQVEKSRRSKGKKHRIRNRSKYLANRKHQRPPMLEGSIRYEEYLSSETWRKVRLWALESAGWQCEECGSEKNLCVHHLTYETLGRERRKHLKVLCKECHEFVHQIDLANQRHLDSISNSL